MYHILFLLAFFALHDSAPVERKMNFRGHKVVRAFPVHHRHYQQLKHLSTNPNYDIDPWSETRHGNTSIDLHIPPNTFQRFISKMQEWGMEYQVLIDDIQSLIDHTNDPEDSNLEDQHHLNKRSTSGNSERRNGYIMHRVNNGTDHTNNTIHSRYLTYPEIEQWMTRQWMNHMSLVQLIHIGQTFEGRPLKVMKIGSQTSEARKPAIWLDAGIHAREWIAPATALYIANQLLSGFGTNTEVTSLVNEFDWYIMPVVNPDGYQYSHDVDRLWRKTRSIQRNYWYFRYRCQGVDANRNFNYQFRGHCSSFYCRSQNPCDDTFSGDNAFSEAETRAMAHFILRKQSSIKMYISLHGYSQMWLTPWGFTTEPPEDFVDLLRVANKAKEALSQKGTSYTVGSPATILYPAGGGSYDWAKAMANIKYSYTVELPDKGYYGFLLPTHRILPVGEETFSAVKAAVTEMKNDTCWMYGVRCHRRRRHYRRG